MSATVQAPAAGGGTRPPAPPPATPRPPIGRPPWVGSVTAGAAVLLAGGPVAAVVQGPGWLGYGVLVVAAVVGAGILLHRMGALLVTAGQCLAILLVLTVSFADDALLGVIPGPATFEQFGTLVAGAGEQIDSGTAPVQASPEILFLVTAAFGLLTVAVHLAAVAADAPAAAGVPLLAVFAVPAALADNLLPWWAMAGAAAAFGLLLVAQSGIRRQLTGGTALVGGAVVLALGVGAATSFVGTAGRFDTGTAAGGAGGSIGLSPFTALRGQLDQATPVELFRVRGLTRPTYLRALTLRQYVADTGWQATRPDPGAPLPGTLQEQSPVTGDVADVSIENMAFRDYWLPLYGEPLTVGGELPADQWLYDRGSGTGYTGRPRQEGSWQERAVLPAPTVGQLRASQGVDGVGLEYLDTTGVDPRVGEIAQQVVAGRENNFDRALALQDYFTGPGSAFSYSLQTAPGSGDDALVEFLTVGRVGYCEQFASAMAVMLRTVGVPSRVAVGFTAGSDVGGYRSVTTSDAHAWVEAWFPGVGWTAFDPTPLTDGRAIDPPYVEEAHAEQGGEQPIPAPDLDVPEPLPGGSDAPAPAESPQLPPDVAEQPAPQEVDTSSIWPMLGGLLALLLAVVLAVVAAFVPMVLRARERRRRLAAVTAGGPAAAGAGWEELLAESADRGVDCPRSDTVRAAARRLVREHGLGPDAQQHLRTVVGAVEASWYGGAHPEPGELDGPVQAVVTGIAEGSRAVVPGAAAPPVRGAAAAWPPDTAAARRGTARTRDRRPPELIRRTAARDSAEQRVPNRECPRGRSGQRQGLRARGPAGQAAEAQPEGVTPARTGGGSALPSGR